MFSKSLIGMHLYPSAFHSLPQHTPAQYVEGLHNPQHKKFFLLILELLPVISVYSHYQYGNLFVVTTNNYLRMCFIILMFQLIFEY